MPTLRNVPVDAAVSKEEAISEWLAIKAKHGTEDCFDSGDDVDAQREARSMAAGEEQDKDWARLKSKKEAAKRLVGTGKHDAFGGDKNQPKNKQSLPKQTTASVGRKPAITRPCQRQA